MTETLERTKTYQQFIGGDFVDAADGRTAEVINPANDQVIANVPASSQHDVDRAVDAAATAFEEWKNTTPQDRSLLLLKIADALEAGDDARVVTLLTEPRARLLRWIEFFLLVTIIALMVLRPA